MEKISYAKLTDPNHFGTVVRMYSIGRKRFQERYKDGNWVQTALMLDYFNPDGRYYDCYEYITEEEADKLTSSDSYVNREDLDKYESEDWIILLDYMFMLSDQMVVPKDIEELESFDLTKKKD